MKRTTVQEEINLYPSFTLLGLQMCSVKIQLKKSRCRFEKLDKIQV